MTVLVLLPLASAAVPITDDAAFFEQKVLPILEARCLECHGSGEELRAGLWLTSREGLLAGGESGPAVDLADPLASLLLRKISYQDEYNQMPPTGPLPEAERQVLRQWVQRGIPWSDAVDIEESAREGPRRITKGDGLEGWAYEPLSRPIPPTAESSTWSRNAVDRFVLARLEDAGLEPAPEADRRTLVRRLTYDLTGLPPTPEEVEAFITNDSPTAYEELVDQLLSRPEYGERWARHWLDVVRYAETNGFERDGNKPNIWRYRDWVVDALNRDLPYDEFVRLQVAGDELAPDDPEALVATGFLRLGQWDDEPAQGRVQARYDVLDDIVRTTSEAFLASTLGCARCHDHKGDPIDQTDYYSFMAFFEGLTDQSSGGTQVSIMNEEEERAFEARRAAHEESIRDHDRRIDEAQRELAALLDSQDYGTTPLTDLRYRFYRDTWDELPEFDALRAEDEGAHEGLFDLSPATRPNAYGLVFEGRLSVPSPGTWEFRGTIDDRARLTVDGREVLAGSGRLNGAVELAGGSVPIRLDYMQHSGAAILDLSWRRRGGDVWSYTTEDPGDGWQEPGFDAGAWPRGEGGFGNFGDRSRTEWTTSQIWIRREFVWDTDSTEDLVLLVQHDEGAEVYLNGVEALRVHHYRGDYGVFEVTPEARAAVRRGTNTIAVHCSQTNGGQYIHARAVHRHETRVPDLAALARGWSPLSASRGPFNRGDFRRLVRDHAERLMGRERAEELSQLLEARERLNRERPRPERMAYVATERGPDPPQMHVHVRGNALAKGEPVEPDWPHCMDDERATLPRASGPTSGRRAALARWLTAPDNALAARTAVNRIWAQHFGTGIVPSVSDFGELGERPTHPLLLDWLAGWFLESGTSMKALHRLLVTSATYRQDSRPSPEVAEAADGIDPTNTLLWAFRMRRMGAEEVRDSLLAVTERLNPQRGGPPIFTKVPQEVLQTSSQPGNVWGRSPEDQQRRRSLYIKVKRSLVPPELATFDFADTDAPCPTRFTTIQPQQALHLMNSESAHEASAALAELVGRTAGQALEDRIDGLYQHTLQRPATADEVATLTALQQELIAELALDPETAFRQLALLTLNLNEFMFID